MRDVLDHRPREAVAPHLGVSGTKTDIAGGGVLITLARLCKKSFTLPGPRCDVGTKLGILRARTRPLSPPRMAGLLPRKARRRPGGAAARQLGVPKMLALGQEPAASRAVCRDCGRKPVSESCQRCACWRCEDCVWCCRFCDNVDEGYCRDCIDVHEANCFPNFADRTSLGAAASTASRRCRPPAGARSGRWQGGAPRPPAGTPGWLGDPSWRLTRNASPRGGPARGLAVPRAPPSSAPRVPFVAVRPQGWGSALGFRVGATPPY